MKKIELILCKVQKSVALVATIGFIVRTERHFKIGKSHVVTAETSIAFRDHVFTRAQWSYIDKYLKMEFRLHTRKSLLCWTFYRIKQTRRGFALNFVFFFFQRSKFLLCIIFRIFDSGKNDHGSTRPSVCQKTNFWVSFLENESVTVTQRWIKNNIFKYPEKKCIGLINKKSLSRPVALFISRSEPSFAESLQKKSEQRLAAQLHRTLLITSWSCWRCPLPISDFSLFLLSSFAHPTRYTNRYSYIKTDERTFNIWGSLLNLRANETP